MSHPQSAAHYEPPPADVTPSRAGAGRGSDRRVERPAPQDRGLRLARASRRGLPHRATARFPQPATERPWPGGAGRADPAAPRRDSTDDRGGADPGTQPGANVRDRCCSPSGRWSPLVSIALNFLSVAAAYGLITFIFQDGRLQGPLGYASSGAITPWVPLFLFTFLFGISMDPRLLPEQDQGTAAARRNHAPRHHGRDRQQRRGGLQRSAHHSRRLLHLHWHGTGRTEDARRRPGRRHPAGRHHRPQRPPPRLTLCSATAAGTYPAAPHSPRHTRKQAPRRDALSQRRE